MTFEKVWEKLKAEDTTGTFATAEKLSLVSVEAIEYAFNSGYAEGLKAQRPQGKWIENYSGYGVYYRCSNCHKLPPNYECDYKEGAIKTNFCPNCGAKMEETNE